jgi:hypothetical protein
MASIAKVFNQSVSSQIHSTSSLFLLALSIPVLAFAQTKPDFSGTWKMDVDRSDSAHQTVPVGPITLEISQTPAEITMETITDPKDRATIANEKLTYRLNGTENTTTGTSGQQIVSKARWEGPVLIAETAREMNGSTVTTRWTLKLDSAGKELTLHKTLTVQHGYQSPDPKNVGRAVDIFVRTGAAKKK